MMSWPIVELGDLAEFRNGINYNQSNFGSGIKVIGVVNFQNYTKPRYNELEEVNPEGVVKEEDILQHNDILFVRSNGNKDLIGRSLFIEYPPEPVTFSGFCIRTRFFSNQAFPRFFAYIFRSDIIRKTLSAYGGGTNIANLNQKILSRLKVPLPPLETQKRIAEILSKYDNLIDNNNRRIALLEESIHLLYKDWFVRLRFPGYESVKVVDGIPDGWEKRTVSSVCLEFIDGDWIETKDQGGEDYRLIQISNIGNNEFIETNNFRYITEDTFRNLRCQEIVPGDIIISRMPKPIGRAWMVTPMKWKMITAVDVTISRPNPHIIDKFYYLYHLNSSDHIARCESYATGTTRPRISRKNMATLPILIPPIQLQKEFGKVAQKNHEIKINLQNQNNLLQQARDLLLPRLMSGKITV